MTLKESLDEIFLLGGKLNQPNKYGLDNISRVLSLLGMPQEKVPYFHITGTKGKGSTADFIYSILEAVHFKTGLYISPSLVSTLERISINGELISPKSFASIYARLKQVYGGLSTDELPSTFETFTIIAFLYFLEEQVDFGVAEVGLGGRLDATNVLTKPVVSVITDVSYDHQKYLGDTLPQIAYEKAKIIKRERPVVIGVKNSESLNVIIEEAKNCNAPYYVLGKDFSFENVNFTENGAVFDFTSSINQKTIKNILINSYASYKIVDATIAIQAILSSGLDISEDAIRDGVKSAVWPGRFEIISKNPTIILDGAHNDASARVLKESIQNYTSKKVNILFSMLADKNVYDFLFNIKDIVSSIFITTVPNSYSRALNAYKIFDVASKFFDSSHIFVEANPRKAYLLARENTSTNDVLVVTGSLYLVGFIRMLENIFVFI